MIIFFTFYFQANGHEHLVGNNTVPEQGVFAYLHRWLVVTEDFSPQELDTVVSNVTQITTINANHLKVRIPSVGLVTVNRFRPIIDSLCIALSQGYCNIRNSCKRLD